MEGALNNYRRDDDIRYVLGYVQDLEVIYDRNHSLAKAVTNEFLTMLRSVDPEDVRMLLGDFSVQNLIPVALDYFPVEMAQIMLARPELFAYGGPLRTVVLQAPPSALLLFFDALGWGHLDAELRQIPKRSQVALYWGLQRRGSAAWRQLPARMIRYRRDLLAPQRALAAVLSTDLLGYVRNAI